MGAEDCFECVYGTEKLLGRIVLERMFQPLLVALRGVVSMTLFLG